MINEHYVPKQDYNTNINAFKRLIKPYISGNFEIDEFLEEGSDHSKNISELAEFCNNCKECEDNHLKKEGYPKIRKLIDHPIIKIIGGVFIIIGIIDTIFRIINIF